MAETEVEAGAYGGGLAPTHERAHTFKMGKNRHK